MNIDGDLEDAASFVDHDVNPSSSIGSPAVADTPAGLLRVAKAMATAVCDKVLNDLTAVSQPAKLPILLLTGHSAGGGVAGLIAAHIRAQRADILVQCIA